MLLALAVVRRKKPKTLSGIETVKVCDPNKLQIGRKKPKTLSGIETIFGSVSFKLLAPEKT